MRVTVIFIALVLALGAAGAAATRGYFSNAWLEAEENQRSEFDSMGQRTCIREAIANVETEGCPRVEVPVYPELGPGMPVQGTLVLDSFYVTHTGVTEPGALLDDLQASLEAAQADPTKTNTGAYALQGNNLRRDTGGALPDVILPGVGQVRAWHGWWDDANSNGIIESWHSGERATMDEWHSKKAAKVAAYIDPGSHPDWRSLERPGDSMPDFWYARAVSAQYTYYQNGLQATNFILFTDGSIFQSVQIRSVSDPLLAPKADGSSPFQTTTESLVDIDAYTALGSGPLEGLYASTIAGPVNHVGSPSASACPSGCRPGIVSPEDVGFPELNPVVAPLSDALYARYPQEWREGEGSTSSGFHEEHKMEYRPWIDLIPTWGYRSTSNLDPYYFARGGPLPGQTSDGRQAMLPGFLSFEIRTGLWKDLDGDGYVGRGGDDPYHGGTKPMPDDYLDPKGEFFGLFADERAASHASPFSITLIPDTTWGRGILAHERISVSGDGEPIMCHSEGGRTYCVGQPNLAYQTGAEPVVINARRDVVGLSAGDDRTAGLYRSGSVLFPFGTEGFGFTACTDELTLVYETFEGTQTAKLRDCDWIGPLATRT